MGNLVSSCGSPASSPSSPTPKNNSKNTIPKTNTPPPPPGPAPAPSPDPRNSTKPLKANKTPNFEGSNTVSGARFSNTVKVREIPSGNNVPKNNSVPENLKKMNLGSKRNDPKKSAMKPNTRTNQQKAQGVNPNENVLINSLGNALVKAAEEKHIITPKENRNALFSPDNLEEELLLKMTKPTNTGESTPKQKMDGGRRRKTRKQRKHRKNE